MNEKLLGGNKRKEAGDKQGTEVEGQGSAEPGWGCVGTSAPPSIWLPGAALCQNQTLHLDLINVGA